MNWRKSNRWLHRQLGFLFAGMAVVYGISGIALNHSVARHWNPDLVEKKVALEGIPVADRDTITRAYIIHILEVAGERKNYKQFYYPDDEHLMIYLKGGHILLNHRTGDCQLYKIRRRSVFPELNFLHYNKAKNLWTWFADLFGLSMIILPVTGIIMVKGKKGLRGSGGWLLAAGILVPLLFLSIYLWF